ncbi:ATP-binding protein [Caenimonas soli]|uniref:ATP-binding protein n=1 Tax=Caenimonas soli TaxID=2735555 RepID=UPI001553955A|nr:ATP-binding protein [Caenimonas soli]NPC56872.1 PAS domain-containing protein [Caenimonas soli]
MLPAAAPEVQRQILGRAARLLASAADFNDTLRQTIDACLPALADFGFFDVVHGGGVRRTVAAHEAPDIEALLAPTQWVRQERTDINLCALSSGRPALHPQTDDAWYCSIAVNEGHLALLRRLAFTSMITVPVRYRDEVVGGLTLFMGRSGRRHTPEDVAFAAELAMLAAPVVVNARLVEQHQQAEDALRISEERLRMAVEAGQVGIWDWDIVRNHVTWSDRIYEMHEMELGGDTGGYEGFRARVHPEDFPKARQAMRAALAGGPPYTAEYRTRLPDGRTRWITTRGHLVRDAQGQPLRMVGASTDVTERVELLEAERRARGEAEAARRRLELLAKAGAVLSGSLDPDETLQAIARIVVPEIADWCRLDLLDEHGDSQRRLAHHSDPERAERALRMARELRAADGTKGSMAWVMANGRPHHGNFTDPEVMADPAMRLYTETFGMRAHYIVPLVARGRTIGAMGVVQAESGRDITEEDQALVRALAQRAALALDNARLYAEAEATRRHAESANRAKDEFLAMLGHELRNPLAPIASALELMARRNPTVGLDERRVIGRQVAHLSRLIDDLLDVSRITQGKIQLQREAVDMKAIVAHAVELTRPVFEKHQRPVELRLGEQPAQVIGDGVRLTQILCNLLVNAAKFTPADGVVTLALDRADGFVEASVQDNGSGIDAQLLPRVFDLFVQGQQSMDRQAGGLGLGLTIVRTLAEMHGGSVSAASDGPGKGSRFVVRLPASDQPPSPESDGDPGETPAAGSGRIMVVDDNADAADTLAEILRMVGYEARCAGHADEAMALLDSYVPQLALLDIGLPDIDGYQLAGLLRADPRAAGMKLVALTGYGRENDRALALAAKFDEHLVKPVAIDRLLEVLNELMGAR